MSQRGGGRSGSRSCPASAERAADTAVDWLVGRTPRQPRREPGPAASQSDENQGERQDSHDEPERPAGQRRRRPGGSRGLLRGPHDNWDGYDDDNEELVAGLVVGAAVGAAAASSDDDDSTTTTTTTTTSTTASLPCNPSVSTVEGVTYYQCGQQYYVQAYGSGRADLHADATAEVNDGVQAIAASPLNRCASRHNNPMSSDSRSCSLTARASAGSSRQYHQFAVSQECCQALLRGHAFDLASEAAASTVGCS